MLLDGDSLGQAALRRFGLAHSTRTDLGTPSRTSIAPTRCRCLKWAWTVLVLASFRASITSRKLGLIPFCWM